MERGPWMPSWSRLWRAWLYGCCFAPSVNRQPRPTARVSIGGADKPPKSLLVVENDLDLYNFISRQKNKKYLPSGGYESGETFILHLGGGDVKLLAHMSFLHLNVYGWIAHFLLNCNSLRNQGGQKCFHTVEHPLFTLTRAS